MKALFLVGVFIVSMSANAQQTVRLYAAGSLRAVMTEVGAAYMQAMGHALSGEFGASGLLRERLDKGEAADVFASANMEHPQLLARSGKGGEVRMFTRNYLCALVRQDLQVNSANLLDLLLDRNIKLGTSTPKADPSGDYAFELFAKAGAIRPGADVALRGRSQQLTGGPNSPQPPKDRNVYGMLVSEGRADIFLTYCTNALAAIRERPSLQMIQLPANLSVGAEYGLIAFTPAGAAFADFVVSPAAQSIFLKHGFAKP